MNLKKPKCPLCKKRLKQIQGELRCQDCGYHYNNSSTFQETNTRSSIYSVHNRPQNNTYPKYSYEQNHSPDSSPSFLEKLMGIISQYKKMEFIITLIVIMFLLSTKFFSVFALLEDAFKASSKKSAVNTYSTNKTNVYDDNNYNKYSKKETNPLPKSEIFQQFISQVFEKDFGAITPEELTKITSLCIDSTSSGYSLWEYSLENGKSGKFYYDDKPIDTGDLHCFTGLQSLQMKHDSLNNGDLTGLTQLTELWCQNTPTELSKIINPEQLKTLGIYSDMFLGDLTNIDAFTNLSALHLRCRYLKDIRLLSSLKNLKILEISKNENIESFQVLYDMPQMEILSIDCSKLRDLGFVSKMTAIKELTIQNSEILNIDCLIDCKNTLAKLDLTHNYQVTDYNIVSQLNRLTDLTLLISSSTTEEQILPNLSDLPALTRLSIGNFDQISSIGAAKGLKDLTLSRVYDSSDIPNLPNLKSLKLFDMSLEKSIIQSISRLTQLENIDFTDSYIWTNVDGLLSLPHLKEFILNDSTAGFDFSHLKENKSLQTLQINHSTLKALKNGQWDYNANNENNIQFNEHLDMFQYFPNLQEISLVNMNLSDISFAADLHNLQILDITDNYVVSLKPLTKLPLFQYVMCASNPISDDDGQGGRILTEN